MKLIFLILVLLIGAAYYFMVVKKPYPVKNKPTESTPIVDIEHALPLKESFDNILVQNGLKACYNYDASEMEAQSKIPSRKDITSAFAEGVKSLFLINEQNKNFDNLVSGIIESPEDFGLEKNPSPEMIKNAIAKGLKEDAKLEISLVPSTIKEESGIFPPENGEKVEDYWIWHVSAPSYFPGPIWMLVKRDGSLPAYHYGYM